MMNILCEDGSFDLEGKKFFSCDFCYWNNN